MRLLVKMVCALIAAAGIALQTPSPPYVNLPPGWRWSSEGPGYTRTFLRGPDGQEIDYPPYMPTGYAARVMNEMNLASLSLVSYLDNRRVEVSVGLNGQVIVSYPSLKGVIGWSGDFDYWTQAKTTRQAVKAVEIALTRLDVLRGKDRGDEEARSAAEFWPQPSVEYPFSGLGLSVLLDDQLGTKGHPERFEFRFKEGAIVKLANGAPKTAVWTEEISLLGRLATVSENRDGTVCATVTDKSGKTVAFTSSKATPPAAVLAMFAALNYRAW